jgi:hypothetical protein
VNTVVWNDAEMALLLNDPMGPVGLELERLAVQVEAVAKDLVSRPGTGRVYTRHGTAHQAAAAGEPFSAEDPDHLRESIGHRLYVGKNGLVARVGTDDLDGLFQEVGTRKAPAHPYLRPALMTVQGGSASDIKGALAAASIGRALTAGKRETRAIRGALKSEARQAKAARAIGRALSAGPRQQRREALAAKRIGKALRGLG